jgi:glutaredoxin-like protein NrdH
VVKVYSKEQTFCGQCRTTKLALDRAGIEYEVIDIETDEAAHAKVTALGYLAAPVVIVTDNEHWSGFRPDKIAGLAAA